MAMQDLLNWIAARFTGVDWRWELFGLVGEGLFFARLVVQWMASERARRPVLPIAYWYMSLIGAAMLVFYALHKGSFVVLLPQFVGIPMYARSLQLELRHRRHSAERRKLGFDEPGYPWPRVSIVVPAHNEAKVLATTLESLTAQRYPGPRPEIIVALNGCTDASWAVAQGFKVNVVESETAGMCLARNLGAKQAAGDILIFVDADTVLPADGVRCIVERLADSERGVACLPGRPDRGGPVVRICYAISNHYAQKSGACPASGVLGVHRALFESIDGFDESLPQGTSTDFVFRACEAGGDYIYVPETCGITSIRRFEKTGIVPQMMQWRRNHKDMRRGHHDRVRNKEYDVVR